MLSELPECKIILVEKNHKTSCEVLPKKKMLSRVIYC